MGKSISEKNKLSLAGRVTRRLVERKKRCNRPSTDCTSARTPAFLSYSKKVNNAATPRSPQEAGKSPSKGASRSLRLELDASDGFTANLLPRRWGRRGIAETEVVNFFSAIPNQPIPYTCGEGSSPSIPFAKATRSERAITSDGPRPRISHRRRCDEDEDDNDNADDYDGDDSNDDDDDDADDTTTRLSTIDPAKIVITRKKERDK